MIASVLPVVKEKSSLVLVRSIHVLVRSIHVRIILSTGGKPNQPIIGE